MQAGLAQARLRIRESLDAHPELTIILDATGSPSSRLRARFVAQEGQTLRVHINTALGPHLLVSLAGEIDTGAGREPVLGRYRVASCKIAGIGKYQADLMSRHSQILREEGIGEGIVSGSRDVQGRHRNQEPQHKRAAGITNSLATLRACQP